MRKLKNEELDRLEVEEFRRATKIPLIIVLDNIRSAHNVGAVFRTADAFRVRKIYLCGITATPPHKKLRKTALGVTESVDWEYVSETLPLVERLQAEKIVVISLEQAEGTMALQEFAPADGVTYALVLGNEVTGVSQEVVSASDEVLEILQYGTKHSLNVSVSAGIAIWNFYQTMGA